MGFGVLKMSPEELWHLTLAELFAMAEHRSEHDRKDREETFQVMDNLNAFNCLVKSRCAGSDKGDLDDFKLYREEIEVNDVEKSPEELTNIIQMMAKAGVLKPEGGD